MIIDGSNVDGGYPVADSAGFNWGDLFNGGTSGGEMGGGSMLGGVMDMALSMFGSGGSGLGKKKGEESAKENSPDLFNPSTMLPRPPMGGGDLNLPMMFQPYQRPAYPKPDMSAWANPAQQFNLSPQIRWS